MLLVRLFLRSYHNFKDCDSSSSTFSRNDFDRFPIMRPDGYSNIGTRASDSYGYDQSSSSSRLLIEVLDTINMVLIPNNLRNHIFLIMDHQANNISQHI